MSRRLALFATLGALAACATEGEVAQPPDRPLTTATSERQAWPKPDPESPTVPARSAYAASECEREARAAFLQGNRKWAWEALAACTTRRDFMSIRPLLRSPWKEEIARQGAAGTRLLARILVRTGLELGYDLRRIQNAGIPLLDLRQVTDDPKLCLGQFVIMRAQLGAREAAGGGEVVQLFEQRQEGYYEGMGQGEEGQGGGGAFSPAQVGRMGGPGALAYGGGTGFMGMPMNSQSPLGSGMRGGMIGPGRPYSGWPNGAPFNNDYQAVGPVYGNETVDTGREAVLELDRLDPRLTPGVDVAVLAQVVGLGETPGHTGESCRATGQRIVCHREEMKGVSAPRLHPIHVWILGTNDDDP